MKRKNVSIVMGSDTASQFKHHWCDCFVKNEHRLSNGVA